MRVDAGAAFEQAWAGRGAAFGDLDNDGDLDIVVSNVGQPAVVLRNDGRQSRTGCASRGAARARIATGSAVASRSSSASGLTQHFTITTAVGYLSASDKRLVVGLGDDAVGAARRSPLAVAARSRPSTRCQPADAGGDGAGRAGAGEPGPMTMRPMMTRRTALALLAGSARPGGRRGVFAQGVSSRAVKPQPRGKPSGLPFHARFTDVAREAGLTQPIIYGGVDTKRYIVEVVGCGVAFLDYDNDGWLDVFVLSGTRLEDAPPSATNRLYHNNRDGTLHRRHREGRADAHRLGVGGHRRRLRQRRLRRPLHHHYGHERAVSQQRRRHLHRRDREGRPAADRESR